MTDIQNIRRQIFDYIEISECSTRVVEVLKDDTGLIGQEDYLWDYKSMIGITSASSKEDADAKVCDIVKHIAAFHNTLGGYLIFGIDDQSGEIIGCEEAFPYDAVKSRLVSDLKRDVDITSKSISVNDRAINLLYVPKRNQSELPKAFSKPSKKYSNGKQPYRKDDIYYRDGIGSKPATGDALPLLISGKFEIAGLPISHQVVTLIENNLPSRGFNLKDFVGRKSYLDQLWLWLSDRYGSVRLVTGIGGLGKTTLVRNFVETVAENPPYGFQSLIWFSAKSATYDAEIAKLVALNDDDPNFVSAPQDLYQKLLLKLGTPEEALPDFNDEQEVLHAIEEALCEFPSLIVIDDLDSFSPDEQASVFHDILEIMNRTAANGPYPSRCIFTAREMIGAAPRQAIKLQGFGEKEFRSHVDSLYARFGLNSNISKSLMKKFLQTSGGSPLFATAIVRLVHDGWALDKALDRFADRQGDAVRKFAFEREIERLSQSQLRCLYALINLSPCSRLELAQALETSEEELLDDLRSLREFHLFDRDDTVSVGGKEYNVEKYIKLMASVVSEKLPDPGRVERKCQAIRREKRAKNEDVGKIIGQTISLWRAGKFKEALEYLIGQKQLRSDEAFSADLWCILGRAYLRLEPAQWMKAETCFREAHSRGCSRIELFDLWIEALEEGGDWKGVIDVAQIAIKETARPIHYLRLGRGYLENASTLVGGNQISSAIMSLSKGGYELNQAFKRKQADDDSEREIAYLRGQCFRQAILLADKNFAADSQKIQVFDVVWKSFESFARNSILLRIGIKAAHDWGASKLRSGLGLRGGDQSKFDQTIGQLSEMMRVFKNKNWQDVELVYQTEATIDFLIQARERLVKDDN